jgi:hypothetical protein
VAGADEINFAPSLTAAGPATILLTQGELKITGNLSISGPGANLLTIDASGNDPAPDIDNFDGSRIVNIDDGKVSVITVSIGGVTLRGGDVNGVSNQHDGGGAIRSLENLTVTGCTIQGNSAFYSGGGIQSAFRLGNSLEHGSLKVISSSLSVNSGGGGGAVYSAVRTAIITDSTITESKAGGTSQTSRAHVWRGAYVSTLRDRGGRWL